MNVLDKIRGGIVVSCQALEDEPLHSSFIMGRLALAAQDGGAVGIRANTKEDIAEIKKQVDLPIIGIVKRDYADSDVYITATMKEVEELISVGCDIIALDATSQVRPNNTSLEMLVKEIKSKYPKQLIMADCSNLEDIKNACELDFDVISSTLVGYTKTSKGLVISKNDFELLKQMIDVTKGYNKFFIAEGNIDTPQKVNKARELGAECVVVGSMITRPQLITRKFVANSIDEVYLVDLNEVTESNLEMIVLCEDSYQAYLAKKEELKLIPNYTLCNDYKELYNHNGKLIHSFNKSVTKEELVDYLVANKYLGRDVKVNYGL